MAIREYHAMDIAQMTISRYGTVYISVLCHLDIPQPSPPASYALSPDMDIDQRIRLLGILPGDTVFVDENTSLIVSASPSITSNAPKICQWCKTPIQAFGNQLVCMNPTCAGRLVSRILYFISPNGCKLTHLMNTPFYIWKTLVACGYIKSISDLFTPYFHIDFQQITHLSDALMTEISGELAYLCHMLSSYTSATIHSAFIANLLQSLSIPGLTDRLISVIVRASMTMTPHENPLIFTAGCLQQPELLLRYGAHPDDISYLKKCIVPYYQQELHNFANITLRLGDHSG